MNFNGVVIGLASFLIIGIFHPIVTMANFISECGSGGHSCWPES